MSRNILNLHKPAKTLAQQIKDQITSSTATLVEDDLPFIYITLTEHIADPALIQNSLNSFSPGGGVVILGEGSFQLQNVLTVPYGVHLQGAGMFVTYLWYNTNVNSDIATITGSYVTISDLSVRGVDPATQYGNGFGSIGTGRGIVVAAADGGITGAPVYFPTLRNVDVANTPSWCIYDTGQQALADLGTGVSPNFNYELPAGGAHLTGKCISVGLTLDNVQMAFPNSGGALYIGPGSAVPRISNILTNSYSFNTITIAGVQENMGAVQLYNAADAVFSGKCVFQSPSAQSGGMAVVHADTDAVMLALLQSATAHFEAPYFEVLSVHCLRNNYLISTINSGWVMERPYVKSTPYDLATSNGYPLRLVHSPAGETIGSNLTIRDGQFFHYREVYAAGTQPRYLASGSPSVLDRDDIVLEGSLEGAVTIENCTVINYGTGATRDVTTPTSPTSGYLLSARAGASFSNSDGVIQLARFDDCNLGTAVAVSDLRLRWSRYQDFTGGVLGYSKGLGRHAVSATLNSTVNVTSTVAGTFDAVAVGNLVQGTGVPGGAYVSAKASDSAITLSAAATVTATSALTFYGNGTFQREGLWVCSNRSGPDFRQIPYIRMHPSIWSGVEPGDFWMVLGSPVASVYTTARFFWYDGTAWQTQIDRSIGTAAGDLIKYTASDTPARLAIGSSGDVLTVSAGAPVWTAPNSDFVDNTFTIHDDGVTTRKLAFQCSGITAGNTRTLTVPDASGVIALDPTTTTGDMIYKTGGALAALGVGSSGQYLGTAAGTSPTWSNPVFRDDLLQITNSIATKTLTLDTSSITTSATRTLKPLNINGAPTIVGVTSNLTPAADNMQRYQATARTASITTPVVLLTSSTSTAALYRVSVYLKTTTLGNAGDKVSLTLAWNDGSAQTLVIPVSGSGLVGGGSTTELALGTTNNTFVQGTAVVKTSASTDISFTTTLTKTGSPQHLIDVAIESLG